MKKVTPAKEEKYNEVEQTIQQWKQANRKATLTEIEEAIDNELSKLRRKLVEEITQERASEKTERMECPNCGREMVRNGKKKRTLRSKGGEKIALQREQMRCLECGITLFPPR